MEDGGRALVLNPGGFSYGWRVQLRLAGSATVGGLATQVFETSGAVTEGIDVDAHPLEQ